MVEESPIKIRIHLNKQFADFENFRYMMRIWSKMHVVSQLHRQINKCLSGLNLLHKLQLQERNQGSIFRKTVRDQSDKGLRFDWRHRRRCRIHCLRSDRGRRIL